MDKVITTALLTTAAVVAAIMVINAILPSLGRSSGALTESSGSAADRIKTDIDVIHVSSSTSTSQVFVFVKNVGSHTILAISDADVFLKTATTYDRLPYGSGAQTWSYALQGGYTAWKPGATLKITLQLTSLTSGDYEVRIITQNGVSAVKAFSV